jgi:protein-disulfide isomerase
MSAQQLNASSVMQIAKRIGLDVEKLQNDMNDPDVFEHIQTSRDLADALQFTGTPSFVIGDKLIGGYIPQETIMEIIESLRS